MGRNLIAMVLFVFSPALFDLTDRIVPVEQPEIKPCTVCVAPKWSTEQ